MWFCGFVTVCILVANAQWRPVHGHALEGSPAWARDARTPLLVRPTSDSMRPLFCHSPGAVVVCPLKLRIRHAYLSSSEPSVWNFRGLVEPYISTRASRASDPHLLLTGTKSRKSAQPRINTASRELSKPTFQPHRLIMWSAVPVA